MKKTVLIIAGETSGDIHASNLIKSLKKMDGDLSFFGIGGKRMEREGVELLERAEELAIIGIWEVLAKLKHVRRAYNAIVERARESRPDLAILIDYPGFNLAVAKVLKKMGVPVIYYITPQVWAWGKSRIRHIKKYIDKAIVIFKFEEELFKKYGIDATFVGHPLFDRERSGALPEKAALGLAPDKMTLALLPGSRESEVKNTLPAMLETARLMLKEKRLQFLLLKSSGVSENVYGGILAKTSLPLAIIKDDSWGALSLSDFVFTSSGTATLESAIMERPMLITYRTSFLTAILFKFFSKTRFIGLVNIIAGRKIVPEVLQYDAKPPRLAREILSIVSSKEKLEEQVRNLRQVKNYLGGPGASRRAAGLIQDFIRPR